MVPKTLVLKGSLLGTFDWLHDANGIRFLASPGTWPVEAASWQSVNDFVEALFTGGDKRIYTDNPEATRRELLDALGAQMFGASSLMVADLPVADPAAAKTELVFSKVLTKSESAEISNQMPVEWGFSTSARVEDGFIATNEERLNEEMRELRELLRSCAERDGIDIIVEGRPRSTGAKVSKFLGEINPLVPTFCTSWLLLAVFLVYCTVHAVEKHYE
ncbi:hypothetical protein GNI_034910 [Gregarina niphandrodes]|uniref:Uncharacterized protein n=1 Tax=Gregarina niphandrodes TaxID=110365 RepID=A0A023BAY1_GRENI|nr:hypothetical protein GNI_034910 [Gregarina niphandrodes]EZG78549.1 hypothetical protein GNI_034910 [Gregarina niphandrodes]|eukprot:XP_011129255.1 hypothetical protein GNI_034910 [Gregarina niphandrodes]